MINILLLGVAWPAMRMDFDLPLDTTGIIGTGKLTFILFVSLPLWIRLQRRMAQRKAWPI